MPSPFSKFGRNVKSLFRSRSRDGHRNTDHPGAVDGVATPASAPPSAATGRLPPVVVVTPTRSVVDLTENKDPIEPQDTGRHGSSHPLVHPSVNSSGHQSLSERPSFGAATSGIPWQSYDPPVTSIAPSESRQQPVPESAASNATHPPPMPLRHEDTLNPSSVPIRVVPSTSYFSSARDFTVSNLNVHCNNFAHSKTLFEHLNPHVAHGAAHDSSERWNAPACHEETRVAIREDIVSWIKHGERDEEPKRIMWLSGPAGCGKTAIAGSVAETCKEEGLLAATFFFSSFSGSAERSSKRGLIPTLAFHMSKNEALHRFKHHLHEAIERHPDIFHKNLKEQAKYLILEPFRKVHDDQESGDGWPNVVIIDGLDEVVAAQHHVPMDHRSPGMSEDDQVEILRVLHTLSNDPFFPFRIFVASRPERSITNFFSADAPDIAINLFLDAKYNPDADIRHFLNSKFADDALNRLVEMSSGQFIVPVTIIRWVESGLPRQRLIEVLNLVDVGNKNPFANLDALYCHILTRAQNPDCDPHLVVKWIWSINSALFHVTASVMFWRGFLEDEEGELSYRLGPITSLISVPPPNDTSSPITIYHKSWTDFLFSPIRCKDLYVEDTAHVSFVSKRIFVVLKNKGPIVPLPSLRDLAVFLRSFFWLELLDEDAPKVLTSLSENSKAELGSCDVAWWTTASLSNLHSTGKTGELTYGLFD
ncbi:hypothetical protein FA13DRAFT_1818116 [Coprinellus micaceus]|uniref:Nephrocystin 3-like N-terminal domain-containing protein n=1 Tax=Coprinellus micaceus TaxID=71717 RepID=A0A4Y7SS92_COPMI|nr:hypothetical protein FA13DRAFT_1818116 [Coprinellus micaceus]